MTFLLDTHTLLWFLEKPATLPKRVRDVIEDPASSLAVSLATPWEISIKTGIGKLDGNAILDNFETILIRGRFELLATTLQQVIRSGRLPLHHRDPFDRFLAAQALDLGLTVLSQDRIFDSYGVKRLWA